MVVVSATRKARCEGQRVAVRRRPEIAPATSPPLTHTSLSHRTREAATHYPPVPASPAPGPGPSKITDTHFSICCARTDRIFELNGNVPLSITYVMTPAANTSSF